MEIESDEGGAFIGANALGTVLEPLTPEVDPCYEEKIIKWGDSSAEPQVWAVLDTSAAQQVLSLPELLHLIFRYLSDVDLTQTILVNQLWFVESVRYLWSGREQDPYSSESPGPSIQDILSVENLSRFDIYRQHVLDMHIPCLYQEYGPNDRLLEIFQGLHTPGLVLTDRQKDRLLQVPQYGKLIPRLQTLYIDLCTNDLSFVAISNLIGPSVRHLSITCPVLKQEYAANVDQLLRYLFEHLHNEARDLHYLSIDTHAMKIPQKCYPLLLSLVNLRELRCQMVEFEFSAERILGFAKLPNLKWLSIELSSYFRPMSGKLNLDTISSPFPALETLILSGSLEIDDMEMLQYTCHLTTLHIKFKPYVGGWTEALQVALKHLPCLTTLRITSKCPGYLRPDAPYSLLPLIQVTESCRQLETLSVLFDISSPAQVDLRDDHIQGLLGNLPKLSHLVIECGPDSYDLPPLSTACLEVLAQHTTPLATCRLPMPIDANRLPLMNPEKPLFPGMKTFEFEVKIYGAYASTVRDPRMRDLEEWLMRHFPNVTFFNGRLKFVDGGHVVSICIDDTAFPSLSNRT